MHDVQQENVTDLIKQRFVSLRLCSMQNLNCFSRRSKILFISGVGKYQDTKINYECSTLNNNIFTIAARPFAAARDSEIYLPTTSYIRADVILVLPHRTDNSQPWKSSTSRLCSCCYGSPFRISTQQLFITTPDLQVLQNPQ